MIVYNILFYASFNKNEFLFVNKVNTERYRWAILQIDERINLSVKQNAAEAAERQKDKIIPLSSDVKTPQIPSTGAVTPKDKSI